MNPEYFNYLLFFAAGYYLSVACQAPTAGWRLAWFFLTLLTMGVGLL